MNRQHHSEPHTMADKAAFRQEAAAASQSDLSAGQQSMLAAQQSVGNQAVIRRMMAGKANAVQRMPPFEEMNIPVGEMPTGMPAPAGATDPAGGGQQSITGPGGSVDVSGGGVAINSNGPIALNAAMTQASGMMQTPVIMADSVVASSYTPGAGNVW
jgi:hypothetical protein